MQCATSWLNDSKGTQRPGMCMWKTAVCHAVLYFVIHYGYANTNLLCLHSTNLHLVTNLNFG